MMCTDEKDLEELNEMYGPLGWQGYDKDPGASEELMWYGIQKEFNKATSTWSKCGCLHTQTLEPRKGRGDIAAGLLHHWPKEKER